LDPNSPVAYMFDWESGTAWLVDPPHPPLFPPFSAPQ